MVYHGVKAHASLYMLSLIAAALAEMGDSEDKETIAQRRKRYQDRVYGFLSGRTDKDGVEKGGGVKLPFILQLVGQNDKAYDTEDYLGKMAHGMFLDSSTLIHPMASLDPATNTIGVMMQYGSDALADKFEVGTKKNYGRTLNPRGKRYTYYGKDAEGKTGLHKQNMLEAEVENILSGSASIHGLIPSVAQMAYRELSATKDFKKDYVNYMALAHQFGGSREARANMEAELNMRYFGNRYIPKSAQDFKNFLSEDRGRAWHKSEARAPKQSLPQSAPFDKTPKGVFQTDEAVFGNNSEKFKEHHVKFKYNPRGDGDSFELVSQSFVTPLTYESFRLAGVDTFEKGYKGSIGYDRYGVQSRETGIPKYTAEQLGKEASWHVDQLLHGKKVTIYSDGNRGLSDRLYSFAKVEVDGKDVDLGLYLASKGLAMLRPESESHIPKTIPSGRSREDYIKAFHEAEAYAADAQQYPQTPIQDQPFTDVRFGGGLGDGYY